MSLGKRPEYSMNFIISKVQKSCMTKKNNIMYIYVLHVMLQRYLFVSDIQISWVFNKARNWLKTLSIR